MPISKSAKKALKNAEAKASRNRWRKTILKDALKRGSSLTASTSTSKGEGSKRDSFSQAYSAIDKAAKWGIVHPNKAARLKSRLSKTLSAKAAGSGKEIAEPTKKVVLKATAKKAGASKTTKKTSVTTKK